VFLSKEQQENVNHLQLNGCTKIYTTASVYWTKNSRL